MLCALAFFQGYVFVYNISKKGLSDVHNLIAVQIKSNTPSLKNPYKTYRSYKQFNYEAFIPRFLCVLYLSQLSLDLILLYLLKSIFFLNIACLRSWFMYGAGSVDQNKNISGQPLSHLSQTKVAILKTILFQQMTIEL
jgi:hypothetical protein